MAGRQAEVMRCYEPDWLRKTIHVLNKVTIYTEYQGIFLLEPKEREPDGTIAYCNTDVMGTAKSRLGCALPQGNRIAITPDGRLGIRSGETGSVVLRAKNLRVLDPWPMSG